jgi:hypothetical protein
MRPILIAALILCSTTLFAGKRISLLTCGAGEEVYSIFGHSALRIYDSATQEDVVYNYGMFDFRDPNFLPKYIQGELLYFGAADNFDGFMSEYIADKRSVTEQILNLNENQINAIKNGIAENDLPQNKYYKYDFCFLNCSTKLRDLFSKSLGSNFVYHDYMPADSITFMDILNTYLKKPHWIRVGINCILSSKVHAKMSSFQSMFLPKGLATGFDYATINKIPLVAETKVLNAESIDKYLVSASWHIRIVLFIYVVLHRSYSNRA